MTEATRAGTALQDALDAAALSGTAFPHRAEHGLQIDVLDLGGLTSATLAALLQAGLRGEAVTTFPEHPEHPGWVDADTARASLQDVLTEAGIGGERQVQDGPSWHGAVLHLRNLAVQDADTLTSLINAGIRHYIETAADLHQVLLALEPISGVPLPKPSVRGRQIVFEEDEAVSVHTALALGSSLGAPAVLKKLPEFPDYEDGWQIADRLHSAVIRVTGKAMDVKFLPYCARCDADPAVELGTLTLEMARAVIEVLRPVVGRS
ncbi:hypothetical protein [Streptomyces sp. NPDC002690]